MASSLTPDDDCPSAHGIHGGGLDSSPYGKKQGPFARITNNS